MVRPSNHSSKNADLPGHCRATKLDEFRFQPHFAHETHVHLEDFGQLEPAGEQLSPQRLGGTEGGDTYYLEKPTKNGLKAGYQNQSR